MTDDVRDGAPDPNPEAEAETEFPATPSALAVVEALLYASGKPATVEQLAEAAEVEPADVEAALDALEAACAAQGRGVKLDRVAGGVRLVSRAEFDFPVRRLLGLEGKTKLTMAALETLAIVAYRQPVTAPEVMELRGVISASSIRTLLDRKLITTAGRKEVVGTPFLYKTTKEFLVHFGLNDLSALPKPEELEAIYGLEPASPPEPAQVELFPSEDGEVTAEPPADGPPPEETN
jgi:segregation and condensation protein B